MKHQVPPRWKPAPSWDEIIEHYRAQPGRVQWLADRLPAMRGHVEDTPEPKYEEERK